MFEASMLNQCDEDDEEVESEENLEADKQPVLKKRRKAKKAVMFTDADGSKRPLRCKEAWR